MQYSLNKPSHEIQSLRELFRLVITWSENDLMQGPILSCIPAQEMDIVGAIDETLLSLMG